MLIGSIPDNVSLQHRKFSELIEQIKPGHEIFCEYSAKKLLLDYWEQNTKVQKDSGLINRSSQLHFDFYDKTWGILFEIQGDQHFKFNSFFHKTMGKFDIQKKNDSIKIMVSRIIGIKLITIWTNEEINKEIVSNFYN